MNTKLLRKIKKAILADPLRLDMENWFSQTDPVAPCGSTACIAGWAVALSYQSRHRVKWATAVEEKAGYSAECEAGILLKLGSTETDALFFIDSWPYEFAEPYRAASRAFEDLNEPINYAERREQGRLRRQMARITAKRIEHFIKTEGTE